MGAEIELDAILGWSDAQFGPLASLRYEALITRALIDLAENSSRFGSQPRPEFGPAVRIYPVRFSRERARTTAGVVGRPRHVVLYRHLHPEVVGIGRVLHESMDLARHLPFDYGDG